MVPASGMWNLPSSGWLRSERRRSASHESYQQGSWRMGVVPSGAVVL